MNLNIYKDYTGQILFILSIIFFIYMVFLSPLNNVFIHPDEFFTLGIIKLSLPDIITVTAKDVHPPIYYIILKSVLEFCGLFNLSHYSLFISKIVSIVPYLLILIVSYIKLKKEYGWFTIGLFVFSLGIMSQFYLHFLTVRMYSWGLFFLLMSFIYLKDIIVESDLKSWILFTIFIVLGLYCQYFIALSSFLIYLSFIIYILGFRQNTFKIEFKKILYSIILGIILYSPWLISFFSQLTKVKKGWWVPAADFNLIMHSFTYYATSNSFLTIQILAIVALVFFIIISFKKYDSEPNEDNFFILSGFFIFVGTIIISLIISLLYRPILVLRYLIPVSSIIWLSISILVGKLEKKELLIVSLILILILSFSGIANIVSENSKYYDYGMSKERMFEEMNNDDSIIIYNTGIGILEFGDFLNQANSYSPKINNTFGVSNDTVHSLFEFKEKSPKTLKNIVKQNKDKKIYFVNAWGDSKLISGNLTKIGNVAGAKFYEVN